MTAQETKANTNASGHQIVRMKEMLFITALSRATAYRLMTRDKHFPKPIKMGQGINSAAGFLLSDIENWIDHRITESSPSTCQQRTRSRLLRRKDVEAKTSLSRATIYAFMKKGEFPKPITLNGNMVAWLEGEIDEWINQRIANRSYS